MAAEGGDSAIATDRASRRRGFVVVAVVAALLAAAGGAFAWFRSGALAARPSTSEVRALYESCDALGIVDRYVRKLQRGRTWGERAFAARYLGERSGLTQKNCAP